MELRSMSSWLELTPQITYKSRVQRLRRKEAEASRIEVTFSNNPSKPRTHRGNEQTQTPDLTSRYINGHESYD